MIEVLELKLLRDGSFYLPETRFNSTIKNLFRSQFRPKIDSEITINILRVSNVNI